MKFSVIYTVDALCPDEIELDEVTPPNIELWEQTEGDDSIGAAFEGGFHRKWCALLDRPQFDEFVEHFDLFAENVETMGSIGASGCGPGWAPAISFVENNDVNGFQSAYVTPIPQVERCGDERDWKRVRKAVLAVYGQGTR